MLAEKSLYFLIKKTPEQDLKKYGIPNTPSLRRQVFALLFNHLNVSLFAGIPNSL
jgi:hypothetical protein